MFWARTGDADGHQARGLHSGFPASKPRRNILGHNLVVYMLVVMLLFVLLQLDHNLKKEVSVPISQPDCISRCLSAVLLDRTISMAHATKKKLSL